MNILGLSIQRPTFIAMIACFLMVVGLLALNRLPVDLYPSVSYPLLAVRASLKGASPEEIEQLITKRMEDALSTIAGVKTIRSSSREGVAMVMLEFDVGDDIRFQEIQVRSKIGNLRRSLPDDMDEPVIFRQDPDDTPIIELGVTGNRSAAELTVFADKEISLAISQIPGVGSVEIEGGRSEEIIVDLNPLSLESWELEAKNIVAAIKAFNRNDPVGKIQGHEKTWVVRSLSQAATVADLREIVVGSSTDGTPIFLRDVASVTQGFADVTRVSRMGNAEKTGPSVVVNVLKQSGENTVEISNRVREVLSRLGTLLPPDVKVQIIRDNADLVRSNVADVFESLIIGAILTIFVVLLFLRSPRSTFTTGLSLPSSVITAFVVMLVAGFTINVLTLLALSLAVGLLVDDAIVVRENIFRYLNVFRKKPQDAAYEGAKEVILAVVATTLTIVAVFLPVGFMGGMSGQFFKQFALTVVFAVLISLWDALTMAPMLSAYFANIADPHQEWLPLGRPGKIIYGFLEGFENWFAKLSDYYQKTLRWIIPRPWMAALLAFISIGLAITGFRFVKKSFLPTQLGDVFSVSLSGPLALPMEKALITVDLVEQKLKTVPSLESWALRGGSGGFGGGASVFATLRIKKEFTKNQDSLDEVRRQVRAALQGIPGYTVRISEPADPLSGGGHRFQPIGIVISGEELDTLTDIARSVRTLMNEVPGITDISNLEEEGIPEIRLSTDFSLAGHFNLTPAGISDTLATWIEGDTSNNLKRGDDQIPIRVRLADGKNLNPQELLAQNIKSRPTTSKTDISVPLGNVLHLTAGAGPTGINRESRQRVVRLSSNLDKKAALGDVVNNLQKKLDLLALPAGYHVRISGQSEQMQELVSNITWALLLGCLFVFMVLASLFESLLHPIAVMMAIPLAATGAVIALLILGLPFDLYAGIGMILLAGIVAKNSILLVDFAIQRVRDKGMSPEEAILEAAPIRLRPILMTSIAMIAGMMPIALALGSGGSARMGLGVATIGGVLSSTVLTLLIVPNIYIAVERLNKRLKKR